VGRALLLEPIGGIAGDMFLAAALDLGVKLADLERMLGGLELGGYQLRTGRATRHAIVGTHLEVVVDPSLHGHHHRGLGEIRDLILRCQSLPERARARAIRVFEVIGEAEAKIHGVPLEEVHFHEVGAVDSIVDVCGAAAVLELLGDPTVFALPPPLGSGTVMAAHGPMPVPAPATLEILREVPVRFEGTGELTTPTGAALLKALCQVGAVPPLVVEKVGYGVGTKDFGDRANVLRASLGRLAHGAERALVLLETNLDDCSPELLGGLLEQLLEHGALDAWVAPVTMKKSRPGHLLSALVPAELQEPLCRRVFAESTTLGIRVRPVERVALERRVQQVQTRYGPVRVKLGLLGVEVMNAAPEYEDCRARAKEHGVSVKEVWAEALAATRVDR
jgi:pyridinium-3,5-bisthiocarboxylic acid mononucleotide nickel chelatase